jgi:transmembrane sensor
LGSEEVKSSIWKRLVRGRNFLDSAWNSWFKLAAAISIIALSIFLLYQKSDEAGPVAAGIAVIEKSNNAGRKSTIILKDGTVVSLNSDSRITYPEAFSDSARVVHLEGEAYFDVARDDNKPFIVVSKSIAVTAMGTSFNISSFHDSEFIKVSLDDGRINVQVVENLWSSHAREQYVLEAGQEISFDIVENVFSDVENFDRKRVLGWKEGLIVFDSADLPAIIKILERWYGVEIDVAGGKLPQLSYKGEFLNQSLQNVLESIGFVHNFRFKIEDKKVMVMFNEN